MFEGWERRTICHMAAATASLAFRDSDVCKTESRTTIFCCPYSSVLLNHYLLRADPALTVQHAWGPTSLQHKTRHIQVNVHTGLPTVVSPTTDFLLQKVTREPSTEGAKATPAWKGSKSHALVTFHMVVWEFIAIKAFSTSRRDRTPTLTPTITGCAHVQQQKMESIKKYWGCSGRPLEYIQQYRVWTAHRNLELWLKSSKKCFPASFLFFFCKLASELP